MRDFIRKCPRCGQDYGEGLECKCNWKNVCVEIIICFAIALIACFLILGKEKYYGKDQTPNYQNKIHK